MARELNIVVVSDVHAFDGDLLDEAAPSYYSIRPEYQIYDNKNPFRAIGRVLSAAGLKTDWVLCPGDLADRAHPTAQDNVWRALENLKGETGARVLLATVGNHDVDSRLKFDEFDTKGALQSLTPFFPGLPETQCDFFLVSQFRSLRGD